YITKSFDDGKIPDRMELETAMKRYFRPEFLGRLDGIVPFSPLREESMLRIFEIHFRKLRKRLENLGIKVELSENAKKHIAHLGYSEEFGARPLIRAIKQQLSHPLSTMIIKGELQAGDSLFVDLAEEGNLDWQVAGMVTN
ncbi:MAG: ATP-dependent Clp protease ATP-binding subunit, partial [Phaeodactylibacter sp.]|nr:ATP-dependent Clp protease ATP-binding subunit [Phaeodactylibacter sp.]